ncbi:MAG: restriction endonuclease [Ignavibacteriales bacterium]|nr:restriction endonuclease [Ignavibacteriales bacterium]
MRYLTPENVYFRLHHIRPRFKNDVESVLLYIANEISRIPKLSNDDFKVRFNDAIRLYPGNIVSKKKTIDNWRTEISALFGLIQKDFVEKMSWPSSIAIKLSDEQDLVRFFKCFLYYFQYPGGHVKPYSVKKMIALGIKFKPAQYILKILESGEIRTGGRFSINKAELTHCVFNDLRVTRDKCSCEEIVESLINNRKNEIDYDWTGDVIRYAGDILDYMVLANLLVLHGNDYYINWKEREAITAFIKNDSWFTGFDKYYNSQENIPYRQLEAEWYDYVNTYLGPNLFRTDVLKYLDVDESSYQALISSSIGEIESKVDVDGKSKTKDIGDLGESLILGHECMRIKLGNREDLIHLIKRIPTHLAIGYDIQSVELDACKRYIEVKATISNIPANFTVYPENCFTHAKTCTIRTKTCS